MKSDLPKVLHSLRGKPLISHVVENMKAAGIDDVYIVVGFKGDDVIQALGPSFCYVWQREQLGTGHAVMQAEPFLGSFSGKIIIACGDVPLIRPETFRMLISASDDTEVKAAVLTMCVDNPTGYGRIIKNEKGSFLQIVEEKDANPEQKKIREVNTGTYIFDSRYLFQGLKRITNRNAQGEYYLPDVLQYVRESGFDVKTLLLHDAIEGSGINSRDELARLEEHLKKSGLD